MKICFPEVYNCNQFVIIINTVEPVLRGHLWNTKCDLLIQVNTGDCLIEVNTWAGLIVFVRFEPTRLATIKPYNMDF
jgi:hypothetical protein